MEDFSLVKNKIKTSLQDVLFVDLNGKQIKDDCKLAFNSVGQFLISKRDDQRVGKVEVYDDGRKLFYLKTIKFGSPGEIISNPLTSNISAAYGETDSRARIFEYTRVNQETFDLYVKFLTTRNDLYLVHVIRRLNDGEA